MARPRHAHACKSCRYLDTYTAEKYPQDLYLCGDRGHYSIVVVRSDDPDDTFGFRIPDIERKEVPANYYVMFAEGLEIAKSKGLL